MNRQKGLAPILIVMLIALGIGGYLIYSGKINLNKTQVPSTATSPSPTNSDEIANWKTYKDNNYAFSFKYPNIWIVQVGNNFSEFGNSASFYKIGEKVDPAHMMKRGNEQMVLDISEQDFNKLREQTKLAEFIVGGKRALRLSNGAYILLDSASRKVIRIFRYPDDEGYMDQILSTFKFLDRSQDTPEMVTQAFYDWYLSCLDEHFTRNTGKSPNEDCSYQTNPNVDSQLQKNIGQVKDSDPVLCAQNTPRSTKVDKAYITGNKDTVVVHTLYDSSGDNPLNVDLQLIDNKWKIINISCSH